jgi:hypothetical protein
METVTEGNCMFLYHIASVILCLVASISTISLSISEHNNSLHSAFVLTFAYFKRRSRWKEGQDSMEESKVDEHG